MQGRYCSSLTCPRVSDNSLPYTVPASQLERDSSGHFWCNFCDRKRALMDWASGQGWPYVRVQGEMVYAVYSDAFNWYTSIAGANEDMTTALYATLIERKREPLPTNVEPAGVARVVEFIKIIEEYDGE